MTPTGAAIAAAVRTGAKLPDVFTIKKTGMGAGKRNYEGPGMLRAMLIEEGGEDRDRIWKLETNIDDCTGESLGYTMERLMEAGARDVHYLPVRKKMWSAWNRLSLRRRRPSGFGGSPWTARSLDGNP